MILSRILLLLLIASCGKRMDKASHTPFVTVQLEQEAKSENNEQLINAIELNEPLLTQEAIRQGADLNQPNSEGLKPLAIAIQHDSIELISLLIDNGADFLDTDINGNSILHTAIQFKKEKVLYYSLLSKRLKYPFSENNEGLTPLEFAINENFVPGVKILLAYHNSRKNTEIDYRRLFLLQKFHNNPEVMKLLKLNQKLEAQEDIEMLYEKSIAEEFIDGVELIASTNRLNRLSRGKIIIANIITQAGKNFNDHHKTLIARLVRFGLSLEGERNDQTTPLVSAIQSGNTAAAFYLLSLGAKADTISREGISPLYAAAQNLKLPLVELLTSFSPPTEYYYTEENKVYKVKICKIVPEPRVSIFRAVDQEFKRTSQRIKDLLQCH